jgi:glutamate-1-semialdehyde aminotransferase/acyl carrier protein
MTAEPAAPSPLGDRLRHLFAELLGVPPAEVIPGRSFLELGADSLALLRASHEIEVRLGSRVPFRRLLEDLSTVDALAAHLAPNGNGSPAAEIAVPSEVPAVEPAAPAGDPLPAASDLARIFAEQLRLMERQLDLLRQRGRRPAAAVPEEPPRLATPPAEAPRPAFVPYRPVDRGAAGELTPRQQEHLDGLVARLTARTRGSKERAAAARPALASNRSIAGFRLLWKELVYPLIARRAAGAHLWDVDGNEYVDLTMGFGTLLFGHSPDFLQAALREQLDAGVQVGPESEATAEAAELIRELTGVERVTFCNSGTEAVMTALRLARAVTGRRKIALFAGSYHGTFDGVLAIRAGGAGGHPPQAVPMAPGVPPSLIADVLVLDYQSVDFLDVVAAHAGELAAVLVEPRQTRNLGLDQGEALRRLRGLTARAGIALIFDEVVTGFRVHPGGMQALYGVRADLVTYGKAVANGLPIGVVAGSAAYLDAIDGGPWSYGDRSVPEAEITFFTGTFFRHPLVMAAARAVLRRLRDEPGLQAELNERTGRFASALNAALAAEGLPIEVVHFGSIFTFRVPRDLPAADLFFYHLLEKGIYIWEGRICYLSTAHSEADLRRVVAAARESAQELRAGGFFPAPALRRLPLTDDQRELWELARFSDTSSLALNLAVGLRLRGPLDRPALERALQHLIDRHEALRVTFDPSGAGQTVGPPRPAEIAWTDLSGNGAAEADIDSEADALLSAELMRPFDLAAGPLIRFHLVRLEGDLHILALFFHHLAVDGHSASLLIDELGLLYAAETKGGIATLPPLPPAESYSRYVEATAERQQRGGALAEHEAYWLDRFTPLPPPLALPADHPRPAVRTFRGDSRAARLDPELTARLQDLARRLHCTPSTLFLAAVVALLHRLTGQDDLVVGLPVAGHPPGGGPLVGYLLGLLALRFRLTAGDSFADLAAAARTATLDAHEHREYPYYRLLQKLGLDGIKHRPPLIAALFNFDSYSGSRLADLELELARIPTRATEFEVFWDLLATDGALDVECTFNADLFDPATADRWQRQLRTLLAQVAADPGVMLGELELG